MASESGGKVERAPVEQAAASWCRCLLPRREGALALALPYGQRVGPLFPTQTVGDREEGPIERGAVIVGEIDKARLYDEATQFDQMPRSLPPLDLPVSDVSSRLPGLKPMPRRHRAGECRFAGQ